MSDTTLDIAIVGGGAIGVMAAVGLIKRGIQVTVYEKQDDLQEIGAAFAFTGIARECMRLLDPLILQEFKKLAKPNASQQDRYWDGYHPRTKEAAESNDSLFFQVSSSDRDFQGCLRSQLLQAMANLLPEGVIKFGKQLETYRDEPYSNKVELVFTDGTTAEADAVIGCDGLFSTTRQTMFRRDETVATPTYSHKIAYRALIPIEDSIAALGHDKATNQCAQMGPGGHVLTYPVSNWTLSNIIVFLYEPDPWPEYGKTTAPSSREHVQDLLKDWSPAIRELASKLPPTISKWGLFDLADHPAPTYTLGRVCVAGDAAHASSPFHGAGAGMGVEDILVLATVLEEALLRMSDEVLANKTNVIMAALQAYTDVRYDRSQWLVRSSREIGDVYMWRYASGSDPEKIKAEFVARTRKLWDFSVSDMVAEAKQKYETYVK